LGTPASQAPLDDLTKSALTILNWSIMGRTRYHIYDPSMPHFHTCTIVGWIPIFTRPETTQIILDAFRYMQTHHDVVFHAYVILENHLHFIAKAEPAIIQRFKSYTARRIIDYLTVKK
jgi:REP element-mobilizing transposase RayT